MAVVTSDPNVKDGKPYFTGTTVLIEDVMRDIRSGAKFNLIKRRFPQLDYKHVNFAFDLAYKEGII